MLRAILSAGAAPAARGCSSLPSTPDATALPTDSTDLTNMGAVYVAIVCPSVCLHVCLSVRPSVTRRYCTIFRYCPFTGVAIDSNEG